MHKEKKKIFLRLPGSEITLMHIIYDFKRFVEYHCYHNYKPRSNLHVHEAGEH